jgi:small subunit ribosomal protein S9
MAMATVASLASSLASLQLASTSKDASATLGSRFSSQNGLSLRSTLRLASLKSSSTSRINAAGSLQICASSAAMEEETDGLDLEAFTKSALPGGFAAARLWGTGRRKCAVARVVLVDGTGKIIINNRTAQVRIFASFCN